MIEPVTFDLAISDLPQAELLVENIAIELRKWLEDGVFDDAEKLRAESIESQLRRVCERAFQDSGGDINVAAEAYPGLVGLAIAWLKLGGWVLALDIDQETNSIGRSAYEIISSRAFHAVFEAFGSTDHSPLEDFVFPWVIAVALTSDAPIADRWRRAVQNIQASQPDYAAAITARADALSTILARAELQTMADFLNGRENHKDRDHRKSYKDYQAKLSQGFKEQNLLAWLGGFQDPNRKDLMLTVGDGWLAISFKGGQIIEIPKAEIKMISVGSRTERMHTGHSHSDYFYWTVDIVSSSGAQWRLKKMIGSDRLDSNPMREFLTGWLGKLSGHYKIVASGSHEVDESGYRTSTSYGIWF